MDINLKIDASPKLIQAIDNLSGALSALTHVTGEGVDRLSSEQAEAPVEQPQQQQAQPAPSAVPTQQPQPAPVQQPQPQQQQQSVPTSAPSYTFDQLAVAATQLNDAGKREQLVQLLQSFGVQALTGLPEEQYGAFATKLREMGAKL